MSEKSQKKCNFSGLAAARREIRELKDENQRLRGRLGFCLILMLF